MKRLISIFALAVLTVATAGCEAENAVSSQLETATGDSTESLTDGAESSIAESNFDDEKASFQIPSGSDSESPDIKTGITAEQIYNGESGVIHYSYYLLESYDVKKEYPMMVVMPGYDMMWFGESSSGSNLNWNGFLSWTELDTEIIVVSAQLTDRHETSARQAVELTEYFIDNFAVDKNRIYAAGYSAGGETMSQAVSMLPTYTPLIFTVHHNGTERMILLPKTKLLFTSIWLKAMNTTAVKRHARLMIIFIKPMRAQVTATPKLTVFCG